MNRDDFWKLVEGAGSGREPDEQAESIQADLTNRSAEDIVAFERHMAEFQAVSYTWKLWGAAYLINGGCSDDGFDYFRGWLIAQGRSAFEKALADPDSLADLPELEEDVECEGILYVAMSAYEAATGSEIPQVPINLPDLGEGWDFDDDAEMKQRYPKLFAKFCSD
ncbi:MAG: DUF4240 domain-containing protein [Planctomycetes bacterium]|nr:DUF4240 domain-containing protein [Planctomycetota bacterium]MBL7042207.1 DUF4240 domain-containing protein [Pirellulaceae bacterium]